jgi:hypothetical protein
MARRADPERIKEARRAAIRNVLIDESRMSPEVADEWTAKWEAEALRKGIEPSSEYWNIGLVWMSEQLGRKR